MSTKFLRYVPVILLAYSCQTQEWDSSEVMTETRTVKITAGIENMDPATRTELDVTDEGTSSAQYQVYWLPGDRITVFSAGHSSVFVSQNTTPDKTADFLGQGTFIISGGAEGAVFNNYIWGLYPARSDVVYNEPEGNSASATIQTYLPSSQPGKPGGFADDLAIMLGRARESLSMPFKNAYSGLWVKVGGNDIVSMTLRGNNNETLAGRATFGMDSAGIPEVVSVEDPSDEVTIYAPDGTFQANQYYYFITLPGVAVPNGYNVTVKKMDGTEGAVTISSNRTFNRSIFLGLSGNIDDRVTSWHESATQPLNEIWYTTTDGTAAQYAGSDADDVEIIAPDDNDGVGIVRFPSVLKSVPTNAFNAVVAGDNNRKITSVILPETVETISENAFANCEALTSIQMDGVKYIKTNAFYNCGFESLSLPEGLWGIGISAFQGCKKLRSVEIPESVVSLGYPYYFSDNPFLSCVALESFTGKFATDDGLALVSGNGADQRNVLVSFAAGALEGGTYTVPDGVQGIAPYAFSRCKLSEVNFNQVTYLFRGAMTDGKFKHITIPSTLTVLGDWSLAGNTELEYIRVDVDNTLPRLDGNDVLTNTNDCPIYVPAAWVQVFKTADKWSAYADRIMALPGDNEIVYFAGNQIGGDSYSSYVNDFLNTATSHTFENGRGVLTFAEPVTSLPMGAFDDCKELTGVLLPDGVTEIRESAFSNCLNLKSIELPSSLEYIGAAAFENTGLTSVDIPESVQYIGYTWGVMNSGVPANHYENPFIWCRSLASFTGKYATPDGLFLVDDGYLVSGAIGAPDLGEGKYCVIPDEVTTIGKCALFSGQFSYLDLGGTQVLGEQCFRRCENLIYFDMGPDVTEIRSYAFWQASALSVVYFTKVGSLPAVSADAFEGCTEGLCLRITGYHSAHANEDWHVSSIKSHVIVDQVPNEVWIHFDGNPSVFPDAVDQKMANAFLKEDGSVISRVGYCGLNQSFEVSPMVVFPEDLGNQVFVVKYSDTIKQVAANAFDGTGGTIDYISLPPFVTTIGENAFKGLTNLKKFPGGDTDLIDPANSITSIGEYAFDGCVTMTGSVPAPEVTSLGKSAFATCQNITGVTLGAVTSIPEAAFRDCTSLQRVNVVLYDLASIGQNAFYNCPSLIKVNSPALGDYVYIGNVTEIGTSAFAHTGIELVEANRAQVVGASAFADCPNLWRVEFPKATTFANSCFRDDVLLTTVIAPEVSLVQANAFYNCSKLTTLNLPSIEVIGDRAFAYTRSLTTLKLGENLSSIGELVFANSAQPQNYNQMKIYFYGNPLSWDWRTSFCYQTNQYFKFAEIHVPQGYDQDVENSYQNDFGPVSGDVTGSL